jgi:hypothetical protein
MAPGCGRDAETRGRSEVAAMGDEVGVEPERLNKVASALENLRDVLAANVPVIVNTLQQYGQPISLAPLRQAQARSVQDAADIGHDPTSPRRG